MKIIVTVTPKKNVLDPQGAAVQHALESQDFPGLKAVHVGKIIELEIDEQGGAGWEERIDRICRDLLSNPVIEDYRWEKAS
ncbi:MAG: phosphoribosylformylglycinamidine synthase subunit PurS [Opitutales bacterium]|nr:phosphoribosylformylglycinamidine synthase subunit PurS [Opitutales bacterium]MCH8474045.1 phosphoribosylformylglycinamidine synthase subunit PurS [Opitutales bacterium]MCH8540058.1 phosphoribosylformylglycinamidine synthase subunit PurS [Opitutales bacterium]